MTYRTRAVASAVCLAAVIAGSPLAAQQPFKRTNFETVDTSAIQGFSVALVLGDMQGTASPESLPVGARKALADLRDFLPYKSYRLLDAQWIMCCGHAKAGIAGRLRGIEELTYAFTVDVLDAAGSNLSLRFSLRDDTFKKPAPKYTEEGAEKAVRQQQQQEEYALLQAMLAEERSRPNPKASVIKDIEIRLEKVNREVEKGNREADEKPRTVLVAPKGSVIDSTFSMDAGETVVIGTSALKGDKALIALLTAVRRSPSASAAPGDKR